MTSRRARERYLTPSISCALTCAGEMNCRGARLLGAQLAQSAEPVLHAVGLRDFPIFDGLNIDGHHSEALAVCGTPNSSPAGVPVTSPLTITRSPATSTSLMSNFMSGMELAKLPTTLIEVSRPQHSPGR